jgi:hypothetical protein
MLWEPWHYVEALLLEIRVYEARAAYPVMLALTEHFNSQGGLRPPEPVAGQKPSRPLADHEKLHVEDFLTFVHSEIPTRGRARPAFDFHSGALRGLVQMKKAGLLSDSHWPELAKFWELIVESAAPESR